MEGLRRVHEGHHGSADGRYRYWLLRSWGFGRHALFVVLHPPVSDGDEARLLGRCVGFAREWACDGVYVGSLYALRAPGPAALWESLDPVGPDTDRYLLALLAASRSGLVVAAWGAQAQPERAAAVMGLPGMDRALCLGVTRAGMPVSVLAARSGAGLLPFGVASGVVSGGPGSHPNVDPNAK